jgi:hypothetical protein
MSINLPHFAHEIRERDFAEARPILTLLDFRKPQDGGHDRKRLIDCADRFACNSCRAHCAHVDNFNLISIAGISDRGTRRPRAALKEREETFL